MNQPLTLKLISSNHALARALLAGKGAEACAEATTPSYPFPHPSHPSWETSAGTIAASLAAESEMDVTSMHQSPSAAAVVMFPASWRVMARTMASDRLLLARDTHALVEALIQQFQDEHCCSRSFAILQLAAASVGGLDTDGVAAYMTYSSEGCHICTTENDVVAPDSAGFMEMQEELTSDEQLIYLVLCDGMASTFGRIAHGQPLAMAQPLPLSTCLTLCSECHTNWHIDASGQQTTMLIDPCCSTMIHGTCLGRRPVPTCALHGKYTEIIPDSVASGRAVVARGLAPVHGTWYLQLAYWGRGEHTVGVLHPLAIESVVRTTGTHIKSGRWSRHPTTYRVPRRITDTVDALHRLCHLHLTHIISHAPGEPVIAEGPCGDFAARADLGSVRHPYARGMGQMPVQVEPECCLSHGVAYTLCKLEAYSEPAFSRMVERFAHHDADGVDQMIVTWMKHAMPLLPGECSDAGGDARSMHKQVYNAVLSPKTQERATEAGREMRHWVAAQADAVLPTSPHEEKSCLARLGIMCALPKVPARNAPMATPDVASNTTPRQSTVRTYAVFALRVLMNASLYQATLVRVLEDAGLEVGAMDTFKRREIRPIAEVLHVDDTRAFRTACIHSPLYGRAYMWLLLHGARYTTSNERDPTGMLPTWKHTPEEPSRNWQSISDLCTCTDSAYVDLGCGAMKYWRCVLMNIRPAWVFDTDLGALLQVDLGHMPSTVHIVPCAWDDMSLSELGCTRAVVVARENAPRADDGVQAHYMLHAPANATYAKQFMVTQPANHGWCHRVSASYMDGATAYALGLWMTMRGINPIHEEEGHECGLQGTGSVTPV